MFRRFAFIAIGLMLTAFVGSPPRARAADAPDTSGTSAVVELLAQIDEAELQLDLLKGLQDALQGKRNQPMPKPWPAAYAKLAKSDNAEVRQRAQSGGAHLRRSPGRGRTAETGFRHQRRTRETPRSAGNAGRQASARPAPLLRELIADRTVRREALRGLGAYDDPQTPAAILKNYAQFDADERHDALNTLVARPAYAPARSSKHWNAKALPTQDVSAYTARQLQALGDAKLTERMEKVWGTIRETNSDKKAQIAQFKSWLTPDFVKKADLSDGRFVFSRTCQQCHTLYGEGGKVGPDLTGSNRANIDYALENILDPSAVIAADYKMVVFSLSDGRVLSGIIKEQDATTLTVQTDNLRIVLAKDDIEQTKPSAISMMPEHLVDKLTKEQVRDLIGYLATKEQVPLPPGATVTAKP